jgi:hypothetical protein
MRGVSLTAIDLAFELMAPLPDLLRVFLEKFVGEELLSLDFFISIYL